MKSEKPKIKVLWYCHKCGYEWKGVRFRKRYGRGARRASRSICPKCGSRLVTMGYGDKGWKEIRREILKRDKGFCQCCGRHVGEEVVMVVHHKRPVNVGGSSEIENLVLLCEECHKWEHRMLTWVGPGARYSYQASISPLWIFPIPILPSLIIWYLYNQRLKNKGQYSNRNNLKYKEIMKYEKIWRKVLAPNEEIKYEFSIGKKYRYFWLILLSIIGLITITFGGIFLILFALFYFGWYLKVANAYAFTNKRVLVHKGWLSTHLISIDYDKITDITVREPFIDRLITKTGHLVINTAGTGFPELILIHIETPYEVKKKLDEIRG